MSPLPDTACTDGHLHKAEIYDSTRAQIVSLLASVMNNSTSPVDASECPELVCVMEKIEAVEHLARGES